MSKIDSNIIIVEDFPCIVLRKVNAIWEDWKDEYKTIIYYEIISTSGCVKIFFKFVSPKPYYLEFFGMKSYPSTLEGMMEFFKKETNEVVTFEEIINCE